MSRTSSPNSYRTTWSNSMPLPRKVDRYSPLRTFSTAWRTRHSSCRRTESAEDCVVALATAEGMAVNPEVRCSEGRHGGLFDDLCDDPIRGQVLGLRLIGEADPVAKDVGREFLDERRPDEILSAKPRQSPARLIKGERGSRRGAVIEAAFRARCRRHRAVGEGPRRPDNRKDVVLHRLRHVNLVDIATQGGELLSARYGVQPRLTRDLSPAQHHRRLLLGPGIIDDQLEKKQIGRASCR